MILANGSYFGSGMKAAPKAKLDDGLFDILAAEKMSTFDFIKNFPNLYSSKVTHIPQVHFFRQQKITIEPKNKNDQIYVEMDGDTVGTLPASFEILPKCIRFKI